MTHRFDEDPPRFAYESWFNTLEKLESAIARALDKNTEQKDALEQLKTILDSWRVTR